MAMEIKTYTQQIWDTYDLDDNGFIDFDEGYDLIRDTLDELDIGIELSKEDVIQFFELLDKDGNQTLDQKELALFLLSLKRGKELS